MVASFANAMMLAAATGAESAQRISGRDWDTRAGTVELAVPKLREGSYFPDWLLLTHRRRAKHALVTVVATANLLRVAARPVQRLAGQPGVKALSRS
jgi:transposase-like protein